MDDDDPIFDRLDMLERGQQRQAHDSYQHDSSTGYSAYEGYTQPYTYQDAYPTQYDHQDEFVQEPLQLDAFDQRLLNQPDIDSRHGQAALGRARLSLEPARGQASQPRQLHQPPTLNPPRPSQRPDISRFAFDSGQPVNSTSSPLRPSSPTFRLSQQRPVPVSHIHDAGLNHALGGSRPQPLHQQAASQLPTSDDQTFPDNPLELHSTLRPVDAASTSQVPKTGNPIVQGINLVSTHQLPDRFRPIFPFPLFNAVQSKCFNVVYQTNDNFVVSAPTGSGKTAVLELAICRLINGFANGSFKVVYQAPTKSLCSERQRDWQAKFGPLDLQCAELTGDTDNAQLRNVQHASIIVTTPEKWDSITRKWKDHQKLMETVKLFLIDEVHIVKEERGATLEAVVSRMKSVGSNVRFVALSATVPNSQDIATWLGKDPVTEQVPAPREKFGEEFRPVRLQKHVCGYHGMGNDFAFEKTLNSKLTDVITKWSQRKPIMVFCATRKSCGDTAKLLADWWSTKGPRDRYWTGPRRPVVVGNPQLKETISAGVAFHHAGLTSDDRTAVEKAYVRGDINVICCTSTLAVGVNLPCHMVILKGTVSYQYGVLKECSDLEIMQMLGRAGRPQFDNSAVAVIMTRLERGKFYEQMIAGQEVLESCLHKNITEHLNSEIGLGTVTNISTAKKWLKGTFLYVRLKENPEHYHIEDTVPGRDLDERLENICRSGLASLEEHDLVRGTTKLQSTEFGDAMARYYVQFETMKGLLALPQHSKTSEILSVIAQAAEFKDIRFRAGEKPVYKELNKNSTIKFKIPVNIDSTAHKVSLIIQSTLGAIDLPTDETKHQLEYGTAKAIVFQHAHRLLRCLIDCQLYLEDSISARNALSLARSFGSQTWDDSPLHMMQLETLGIVGTRRLVAGGFKSIEDLEHGDPSRIEMLVSRNPPHGRQLQEQARAFPKVRISMKAVGNPVIKKDEHVALKVQAEIGFLNDKTPDIFRRKMVYVCLLAETSDGRLAHFARISAKKLGKGQEVLFTAKLTSPTQTVRGYISCDEFAGTQRTATLKPEVPAFMFPNPKVVEEANKQKATTANAPNTAKRRAAATADTTRQSDEDEFGDAGLDDAALVAAESTGFTNIDDFDDEGNEKSKPQKKTSKASKGAASTTEKWEPKQLPNGKWECNHRCSDKHKCKHTCCREGLDAPRKPSKPKEPKDAHDPKQTKLDTMSVKTTKASTSNSNSNPLAAPASTAPARKQADSKEARDLDRIHNNVKSSVSNLPFLKSKSPLKAKTTAPAQAQPTRTVSDGANRQPARDGSSDYGLDSLDDEDLPADFGLNNTQPASRMSPPPNMFNSNDDDHDDLLGDLWDYTTEDLPAGTIEQGDTTNDDVFNFMDKPITTKERPIFITGDTSSSEIKSGTHWQHGPTSMKRQREDDDGKVGSVSNFFPPAKKRKESTMDDLDDEMLFADNDYIMEEMVTPAPQHDDAGTKDDAQPQEASLKDWFEKEFGTDMFDFVD